MYFTRAYLLNAAFGADKLNVTRFSSEVETKNVGEEFELHRSQSTIIENKALKEMSYWQDNVYEFDVVLSDVKKTQIAYTTANTDSTVEDQSMESAVVYTANIGDVKTIVLAYPHHNLKDGDKVTGIFTEIPLIINHDIAASEEFSAKERICVYMLDIRGITMESQFFDIVFCTLMLMLILYFAVKLTVQYINPFAAPTYKQLYKYGKTIDVVGSIEEQLSMKNIGAEIKGTVITENWIVSRDTFKLKIVRNHMQKH